MTATNDTNPTCPKCDAEMKRRRGPSGTFWGCPKYPRCKGTRQVEGELRGGSNARPRYRGKVKQPRNNEAKANLKRALHRLDADQRVVAAWEPKDGNLRVVAAAGSGKTTTIVTLAARLIRQGVDPSGVVLTTFTNKAGRELADRLISLLPPGSFEHMRVGTFHSLALRAVRNEQPERWDFERCLDSDTRAEGIPSSGMLWRAILGWGDVPGITDKGLDIERAEPRAYQQAADVLRSRGINRATSEAGMKAAMEIEGSKRLAFLGRAWAMYERAKRALGAWDFADALAAYLRGLEGGTIRDRAEIVIVDEAQDNSKVQLDIARNLARNGKIILVGDGRQAIYEWRGAFPTLFQTADTEIGCKTLELRNNYRSGNHIVWIGNEISRGKDWAIGSPATATRELNGQVEIVGSYEDPNAESESVAEQIAEATRDGERADAFSILVRTNAQSGPFETALVARKIPVVVVGATPFFGRKDVKDILAYCTLSTEDDIDALARIANKPRRFLGKKFVDRVRAKLNGLSIPDAIEAAFDDLPSRQMPAALELADLIRSLRNTPWPEVAELAGRVLVPKEDDNGGENGSDSDERGIYATLATMARRFDSANALLRFADRCSKEVQEISEGDDIPAGRVTISTIHRAKGLEWKQVFISASEGVFPHSRSMGDPAREAEEERLFYVAVTRAKDAVTFTWSEVNLRGTPAGPSPFLDYVAPLTQAPAPGAPESPAGG